MSMIRGVNRAGRSVVMGDVVRGSMIGGAGKLPGLYQVIAARASNGYRCEYRPFEPVTGWTCESMSHCHPVICIHDGKFLMTARLNDMGCRMLKAGGQPAKLIINGLEMRFNVTRTWGNKQPVQQSHFTGRIDMLVLS